MLRAFLLAIGCVSILAGFLMGPIWPLTGGAGVALVGWGAVLVIVLLIERFRYRRIRSKSPGPGFQPTAERFVDDETGAMVTVWERRDTGERAYVRD